MTRSNAWRIITAMKDAFARRNFPPTCQRQRKPMGVIGYLAMLESPITKSPRRSCPNPASTSLFDLGPKDFLAGPVSPESVVAITTTKETSAIADSAWEKNKLFIANLAGTYSGTSSRRIGAFLATTFTTVSLNVARTRMKEVRAGAALYCQRWGRSGHGKSYHVTVRLSRGLTT